jgi:hypothetical protein
VPRIGMIRAGGGGGGETVVMSGLQVVRYNGLNWGVRPDTSDPVVWNSAPYPTAPPPPTVATGTPTGALQWDFWAQRSDV